MGGVLILFKTNLFEYPEDAYLRLDGIFCDKRHFLQKKIILKYWFASELQFSRISVR